TLAHPQMPGLHACTMPPEKPAPGTPAPDFTAPVIGGSYQDGDSLALSSLRGHPVVLYFYPKDDTPGCTTQACGIRDSWSVLSRKAKLFGISGDSLKKHAKFQKKHDLPFPLLSDEDHHLATTYGVWVEKMLYGRKYMGTERSTFVIDKGGLIKAVLEKVRPEKHVELVLAALG
ncbi:MAG TPA: peroxiredoxin, partial [Candidatus Saccharimonadia bacterium]|nr:peroxiredoxin [Candidatus Saccharimonadia bacterium]